MDKTNAIVAPSCAQVARDGVLVVGGMMFEGDAASVYNISTSSWHAVAPLKEQRRTASAVTLPDSNNNVLLSGGDRGGTAFGNCVE